MHGNSEQDPYLEEIPALLKTYLNVYAILPGPPLPQRITQATGPASAMRCRAICWEAARTLGEHERLFLTLCAVMQLHNLQNICASHLPLERRLHESGWHNSDNSCKMLSTLWQELLRAI